MAKKQSNLQSETKKILSAYAAFTIANRNSTFEAINIGRALSEAKKKVKENKGNWEEYVESDLPNIAKWEDRDFRFLADRYQKHPLPCLLWLNQTNLKKLFSVCDGESPIKALKKEQSIDFITEDANEEEIRTFQCQIKEYLKKKEEDKKNRETEGADNGTPDHPMSYYRKRLRAKLEEELNLSDDEFEYPDSKQLKLYKTLHKRLTKYIKRAQGQSEE